VIVKPVTGNSFQLGAQDRNAPVGSEIDTSHGEVDLRSASGPGNASAATHATTVQDAKFSGAGARRPQQTKHEESDQGPFHTTLTATAHVREVAL
jgi:hypothetical protein